MFAQLSEACQHPVQVLKLTVILAVLGFSDWWLTLWIAAAEDPEKDEDTYKWIYGVLSIGLLATAIGTSWWFVHSSVYAGKTLHHDTISKVLFAPLMWHESNPSGRIASRFSADLMKIDLYVSHYTDIATGMFCQLALLVVVICVALPPMIPIVLFTAGLYFLQVRVVDKAQRGIKSAAVRTHTRTLRPIYQF